MMDPLMVHSPTIANAKLNFLDTRLALIHIPRELLALFVQPIIRLLMHNNHRDSVGQVVELSRPWMFWHPLVHVSITPHCFIVCPRHEVDDLFVPVLDTLSSKARKAISISREDYSAILIFGEGLDAGQRVLDLTTPLALAGVSIHFITSYYSDFILLPYSSRHRVIQALGTQGFIFEADENGEANHMVNVASPLLQPRRPTSGSGNSEGNPFDHLPPADIDAPPATISELQSKTFAMLRETQIFPTVDESIELVTCAGVKDRTASASANNNSEGQLQLGITKCLTSNPPPRFLAITLTDSESASLTLEKSLLSYFHNDGEDILLGNNGPEQAAVTLDLSRLPVESIGIVCLVAGSLRAGMASRASGDFTYLSTGMRGHVIVYRDELDDALAALKVIEQDAYTEPSS